MTEFASFGENWLLWQQSTDFLVTDDFEEYSYCQYLIPVAEITQALCHLDP